MSDPVHIVVASSERRDVARTLLAAAECPSQVVSTSDGFVVPRSVWEAAYGPPEPVQEDPEPAQPEPETRRTSSGRFAKRKTEE